MQITGSDIEHCIRKTKSIVKEHFPGLVTVYHFLLRKCRGPETAKLWPTLIDKLNRRASDIFFVEIGAMDGVSFDPLHKYVLEHNWRGLLVEPLPDLFEELKKTYSNHGGLIFENVAIAETAGRKKIYRVSLEAVKQGLVPYWAKGISSFFDDRNEIGGVGISKEAFAQLQPYIVSETVACETLHELLRKYNIKKVDLLQLDLEGYDYYVLKQLDLDQFNPRIVRMEWCVLPDEEKELTIKLFKKHGYRTRVVRGDLLAWRKIGFLSLISTKAMTFMSSLWRPAMTATFRKGA